MHTPTLTRGSSLLVILAAAGAAALISLTAVGDAAPRATAAASQVRVTYVTTNGTVGARQTAGIYAACPRGSYAIGGGATIGSDGVNLLDSAPYELATKTYGGPADAWVAYVGNTTSKSARYSAYAVCESGVTATG